MVVVIICCMILAGFFIYAGKRSYNEISSPPYI